MLQIAAERRLPIGVIVPALGTIEAMAELDTGEGERFETPEELFAELGI